SPWVLRETFLGRKIAHHQRVGPHQRCDTPMAISLMVRKPAGVLLMVRKPAGISLMVRKPAGVLLMVRISRAGAASRARADDPRGGAGFTWWASAPAALTRSPSKRCRPSGSPTSRWRR